uniref:Glutamine amidotransferase like class 1 domain containing 3A n=1 Tax=Cyprinus carpio TaxID=7962 RepID=A0A8C1Z3R8_CYPCA
QFFVERLKLVLISIGSSYLSVLVGSRYPDLVCSFVLSGCGVYDGTEIHEASAILVHLSRGGAEVQMFAPDVSQMHVIDHGKGQPVENESRNVLSESARIARGSITDLAKLNVSNHDAVIFPGGFAHVDKKNKVVTTPAFMCETKLHLIFDGIGAMVRDVLKLSGK